MESSTVRVVREPEKGKLEAAFRYLETIRGEWLAAIIGGLLVLMLAFAYGTFSQRSKKIQALRQNRIANAEVARQKMLVESANAGAAYLAERNKELGTELRATEKAMKALRPTIVQRHYHAAKPASAKAKAKPPANSARGSLGRKYR